MAIAWAIAKGTRPIIGVTKPSQVEDAAKAAQIVLSNEEMGQLETLAKRGKRRHKGFLGKSHGMILLGEKRLLLPVSPLYKLK